MQKIYFLLAFFFFSLFFCQNKQANDCINYIQICGNQTISLNPIGRGIQELSDRNVCNGSENNSLWMKFTVRTSGTLGFDLIPTNTSIDVDYDFWIFGPNATCDNLGNSLRCSTTNPQAAGSANNHTGMRDSEPDGHYSEGPGANGDSYVKSLNVLAGESYFLVIDRPIGDGAFSLNWTGTAVLEDPFVRTLNNFGTVPEIAVCNPDEIYDLTSFTSTILNNNPDFKITFYNTYEDASYDQNRITAPQTLQNHDYYYRIQSSLSECFKVETIKVKWKPLALPQSVVKACKNLNNEALFNLSTVHFTDQAIADIKYYRTLPEAQAHLPGTEIENATTYLSAENSVFAWVKTQSGCENSAEILLKFYPVPNINTDSYNSTVCDNDLDNSVNLKLSAITPLIVNNSADFEVHYFLTSDPSKILPDDFVLTQSTDVTIEVKSKNGCSSVFGTLNFAMGSKIILNTVQPQEICNTDRSGSNQINLNHYTALFTSQANATFYETLADAKKANNSIAAEQKISANKNYYYRFENGIYCPEVGELKLIFKTPKISRFLKDEIICKENSITLDAGSGFDSYLWSSGSTNSSSGILKVGKHWVDLTFDGCTTRQTVDVIAEEEVNIKILEIENDKLSVTVSGGTPPYEYSLNNSTWQSSHIFTHIPKGLQHIYVRSAKKCSPSMRAFSNIGLTNLITPNGDGKNDILDFSGLSLKNNIKLKIFDRYGKIIFEGKEGHYVWDGKEGGRSLPTDSYWYLLEWTEPDTGVMYKYNSWIFLKNK